MNKHGLLIQIWEDWNAHSERPEDSFIYKFLRDENERKAEMIQNGLEDLIPDRNGIRKDNRRIPLFRLIEAVGKSYRIGRADASTSLDRLERLICSSAKASRDSDMKSVLIDIRRASDKAEREMLARELFRTDQTRLSVFKDRLLRQEVSSFFNPYGFRKGAKAEDREDESYKDDVRLYSEYMRYTGSKDHAGGSYDYREDCIRLFDWLNSIEKEGRNDMKDPGNVLIPLFFNPATGAGVYIIGRNRLHCRCDRNCSFAVIGFAYDTGDLIPGGAVWGMNVELFEDLGAACDSLFGGNEREVLTEYDYLNDEAYLASEEGYRDVSFFFQHYGADGMTAEEKRYDDEFNEREKDAVSRRDAKGYTPPKYPPHRSGTDG